jgi:hypothetical protein
MHEFHDGLALIYTVPYVWNNYELMLQTVKPCNSLINNLNIFDNVTDLVVQTRGISDDFQYYFSNVKSLKLTSQTTFLRAPVDFELRMEHIIWLKRIMNFSKLKQLNFWGGFPIESSALLQILKEAPQLSLLYIERPVLLSTLDNNELREYLNQMIYELCIHQYGKEQYMKSNELDLVCKTFSNVEQLECCIDKSDDFLFILDHMSKLINIKVYYSSKSYSEDVCQELQEFAAKRNINCIVQYGG